MYMRLFGEFQAYIFFHEEILHIKKSIKSKQATFTQIFYTPKKHKKHKKATFTHKKHNKQASDLHSDILYA